MGTPTRIRPAPLVLVALLLVGLLPVPPASARVVCESDAQTFDAMAGPSTHDFVCDVHYDAFLVIASSRAPASVPLIGSGVPAHFIACIVDHAGVERRCQEGCGSVLLQEIASAVAVRVHVALTVPAACVALKGDIVVVFADE